MQENANFAPMLVLSLVFLSLALRPLGAAAEWRFWLILVLVTQILGFSIGLSGPVAAGLLLSGFVYRFWAGSWLPWKELLRYFFYALPFLLVASMPARFLDTGTYYNQSIRWFIAGVPAGLANLDLFLIQASAAHSFEALGTSLWGGLGGSSLGPVLASFLLVRRYRDLAGPLALDIALALLLFFGLALFAQSPSPELLAMALMAGALGPKAPLQKAGDIGLLIVILLLIKLSFLIILPLLLWQKARQYPQLWAWTALGLVLAAAKMIWLAGWLPLFGSLAYLPWALPEAWTPLLSLDGVGERMGAQGHYLWGYWRSADLGLIGLLLIQLFLLRNFMPSDLWRLALLSLLLGLVFMPQARLFLPLFLYYLLAAWPADQTGGQRRWVLAIPMLALVWVLVPWQGYLQAGRLQNFFQYGGWAQLGWLWPQPNWQLPTEAEQREGPRGSFTLHQPPSGQACFDSAFPCAGDRYLFMTGQPEPDRCYWDFEGDFFYRE